MIIPHPLLGPRDSQEFTYLGDASLIERPDWQAEDAVVLDNSHLTPEQQLDQALQLVHDIAGATT